MTDAPPMEREQQRMPDRPPEEKRRRGRAPSRDVDAQIIEGLTALYGAAGTLTLLLNQYDGIVILHTAQKMAEADLAACKQNPEAYKILKTIAVGNIWTVLILAHATPLIGILANHGVVSRIVPEKLGLPRPPEPTPKPEPEPETGTPEWTAQDVAQAMEAQRQAEAMSENGFGSVSGMAGGVGGPIGDAGTVAMQRAYTAEQIASIRQQAILQAQANLARAQASPENMPPSIYNPMGGMANG